MAAKKGVSKPGKVTRVNGGKKAEIGFGLPLDPRERARIEEELFGEVDFGTPGQDPDYMDHGGDSSFFGPDSCSRSEYENVAAQLHTLHAKCEVLVNRIQGIERMLSQVWSATQQNRGGMGV